MPIVPAAHLCSCLRVRLVFLFSKFQQRVPYDLLCGLASALLDGTVFEIVRSLKEVQHLEERSLYNQRSKLINEYKGWVTFLWAFMLFYLVVIFFFHWHKRESLWNIITSNSSPKARDEEKTRRRDAECSGKATQYSFDRGSVSERIRGTGVLYWSISTTFVLQRSTEAFCSEHP